VLECLAREIRQEKETKEMHSGMEEAKPSFCRQYDPIFKRP
jgi:hypothetical protein